MRKRRKYLYYWRTRLKAKENMEVLISCTFMEVQVWAIKGRGRGIAKVEEHCVGGCSCWGGGIWELLCSSSMVTVFQTFFLFVDCPIRNDNTFFNELRIAQTVIQLKNIIIANCTIRNYFFCTFIIADCRNRNWFFFSMNCGLYNP